MGSLLVSGYGVRVGVKRGLLTVTGSDGKQSYGLTDIDQVIIASSGVTITSAAVRLLVRNGVDIVFLDGKGQPIGRIYPPFINRTVATRRAQYMFYMDDRRAGELIAEIMYAKAYNQAGHLRRLAKQLDRPGLREEAYRLMEEYLGAAGNPRGRLDTIAEKLRLAEALASRIYWEALSTTIPGELGFDARRPGEGGDPVNRCLDYMYGLLYSEAWRDLVLAGLDPYAGFMHTDKSGKPVLVYDYVEMFRPSLVDYPLFSRIRNGFKPVFKDEELGLLDLDTRRALIKVFRGNLEVKAGFRGGDRRVRLGSLLARYAYRLAEHVRGETPRFEGFLMEW